MIFSDVIEIETAVVLLVALGRISTSSQEHHCKEIENLVFDIFLPKSKPITIGVFYRPGNKAEFMNLMVGKFSNLNVKENETGSELAKKCSFAKNSERSEEKPAAGENFFDFCEVF